MGEGAGTAGESSHKRPTAIITGVAGGIGAAVLRRFRDHQIVAVDLDATAVQSALHAAGYSPEDGDSLAVSADFADPDSLQQSLRGIRSFSKEIDSLVNCVGIAEDAVFTMLSVGSMRSQLQVNFIGAMQVAQTAVRMMARRRQGSIVNIASVTAHDGNPGQVAYGASKAALVNATTTMSMELGPVGIRVNSISPGVIDTAMTSSLDPEKLASLKARVRMGRLGRPEEVADVAYWLCSDDASYVTGQTIRVDGCM